MAIVHLTRPHHLLRFAAAATVLTLAGVIGTAHTAHADGPAAVGVAGVATTETETETEDSAVPDADTVVLSIDPAKWNSPRCTLRVKVTYEGPAKAGQARPSYWVTFEKPDGTWLYGTALSDQNGEAVLSVPRPTSPNQTNDIRAALYGGGQTPLVVSNTVDCHSTRFPVTVMTCVPTANVGDC